MNTTFKTHYVQIKPATTLPEWLVSFCFKTHYVQIKRNYLIIVVGGILKL